MIIKLRNGSINLPNKMFNELYNFEWYFSNLIKYNTDLESDLDSNLESCTIEIWEDKEVVLSILDSIKFNKLIIYDNVNVNYLLQLSNYWSIPEHLIEEINNELINEINKKETKKKDTIILCNKKYEFDNLPQQCKLCRVGFKPSENTFNSCKHHPNGYDVTNNRYYCCNAQNYEDFCKIGYHILSNNFIE